MSPQIEALKVPPTLTLARRPTHDEAADERPMLRDARGRVLAVIEQWRPDERAN